MQLVHNITAHRDNAIYPARGKCTIRNWICLWHSHDACFPKLTWHLVHMHVAIVTCANRSVLGALCILELGNRDKDSENLVLILFLQLVDYTAVGKLLDL